MRSAEIRQNGGHFERAIDRPLNLLKHTERVNFGWVAPLFGALSRIESNVAYAGSEFSSIQEDRLRPTAITMMATEA